MWELVETILMRYDHHDLTGGVMDCTCTLSECYLAVSLIKLTDGNKCECHFWHMNGLFEHRCGALGLVREFNADISYANSF